MKLGGIEIIEISREEWNELPRDNGTLIIRARDKGVIATLEQKLERYEAALSLIAKPDLRYTDTKPEGLHRQEIAENALKDSQ